MAQYLQPGYSLEDERRTKPVQTGTSQELVSKYYDMEKKCSIPMEWIGFDVINSDKNQVNILTISKVIQGISDPPANILFKTHQYEIRLVPNEQFFQWTKQKHSFLVELSLMRKKRMPDNRLLFFEYFDDSGLPVFQYSYEEDFSTTMLPSWSVKFGWSAGSSSRKSLRGEFCFRIQVFMKQSTTEYRRIFTKLSNSFVILSKPNVLIKRMKKNGKDAFNVDDLKMPVEDVTEMELSEKGRRLAHPFTMSNSRGSTTTPHPSYNSHPSSHITYPSDTSAFKSKHNLNKSPSRIAPTHNESVFSVPTPSAEKRKPLKKRSISKRRYEKRNESLSPRATTTTTASTTAITTSTGVAHPPATSNGPVTIPTPSVNASSTTVKSPLWKETKKAQEVQPANDADQMLLDEDSDGEAASNVPLSKPGVPSAAPSKPTSDTSASNTNTAAPPRKPKRKRAVALNHNISQSDLESPQDRDFSTVEKYCNELDRKEQKKRKLAPEASPSPSTFLLPHSQPGSLDITTPVGVNADKKDSTKSDSGDIPQNLVVSTPPFLSEMTPSGFPAAGARMGGTFSLSQSQGNLMSPSNFLGMNDNTPLRIPSNSLPQDEEDTSKK